MTSLDVVEASEPISFCIDKSIVNILKTLPEQPIDFEVTKSINNERKITSVKIELRYSSGDAVIPGMDAIDFVKMKDVSGQSFELPIENLRRGLNMTKKFAGTDAMKPVQSAVYFDLQPESIIFAATNGAYMSRFEDKSVTCGDCKGFVFGLNAVSITSSLIDNISDTTVKITSNETNVSLSFGEIRLTTRLVEGRYPNYNSVFPKNNTIEMIADSKIFSMVINRLLTVANPLVGLIRLEAGLLESTLSTSDEFSSKAANETIDIGSNVGITIGFNGSQMQDVLSVISGNVKLSFSQPQRPILIQPEVNDENCDLTLLLMPLILK